MKKVFFTLLLGLGVAFGANIQTLTQQCEANNAKACYDLGVAYVNGKGVPTNQKKAFELFQKACDLGSAYGCFGVGSLYSSGTGVAKDLSKAFSLLKKACDMGWAKACYNVGSYYYDGTGVKKDINAAKNYSKKACSMGDQRGCKNYKIMLRQGGGGGEIGWALFLTKKSQHCNRLKCGLSMAIVLQKLSVKTKKQQYNMPKLW